MTIGILVMLIPIRETIQAPVAAKIAVALGLILALRRRWWWRSLWRSLLLAISLTLAKAKLALASTEELSQAIIALFAQNFLGKLWQ